MAAFFLTGALRYRCTACLESVASMGKNQISQKLPSKSKKN